MGFKGIYKEKSSASKIGILFLLIFVSTILHIIVASALTILFADNGVALIQNQDLTNQVSVNYLKLIQLFSGIGLFITPTLLYAYLTDFDFKFFQFFNLFCYWLFLIRLIIHTYKINFTSNKTNNVFLIFKSYKILN